MHAGPIKEFDFSNLLSARVELKLQKTLPRPVAPTSEQAAILREELQRAVAKFALELSELGWEPA